MKITQMFNGIHYFLLSKSKLHFTFLFLTSIFKFSSYIYIKVKVKNAQPCPTLCNPMDYTVHGILQARILEWVAYPFSRGSSQPRNRTWVSHLAGGFFANWVIRVTKCSLAQGWSCGEKQLRLCRFLKKYHPIFIIVLF